MKLYYSVKIAERQCESASTNGDNSNAKTVFESNRDYRSAVLDLFYLLGYEIRYLQTKRCLNEKHAIRELLIHIKRHIQNLIFIHVAVQKCRLDDFYMTETGNLDFSS